MVGEVHLMQGFPRTGLPRQPRTPTNNPDVLLLLESLHYHGSLPADPPDAREGDLWLRPDLSSLELRALIEGAAVTLLAVGAVVDADTLQGEDGAWYRDRAHHTGQQLAATVSDFAVAALAATTAAYDTLGAAAAAIVAHLAAPDPHLQYHTDARGDARYSLLAHTHTFASLAAKPTNLAGYGITDAVLTGDSRLADARTPTVHAINAAGGFHIGTLDKSQQHVQTVYLDGAAGQTFVNPLNVAGRLNVGAQAANAVLILGDQSLTAANSLTSGLGQEIYADGNAINTALLYANRSTGVSAGLGFLWAFTASTGASPAKRAMADQLQKVGTWDGTAANQNVGWVRRMIRNGVLTDSFFIDSRGSFGFGGSSYGGGVGVYFFADRTTNPSTPVSGGVVFYSEGGVGKLYASSGLGAIATEARANSFSAQQTSTVATGTAPWVIASTTLIANLNAALLGGQSSAYHLALANATGLLALARGGTNADNSSQAINRVFASPGSGAMGAASFRALVEADVPRVYTGTFQVEDLTITGSFEGEGGLFNQGVVFNGSAEFFNLLGVILPRVTTTQRNAISGPVDGLVLYNSTTGKFQGRAAGAWVDFH